MRRRVCIFLTSIVLFAWATTNDLLRQPDVDIQYEADTDIYNVTVEEGASRRLTEFLLKKHHPCAPPDGRLIVEYELEIVHILGIDELKQTMTVLVYVDERWNDKTLSWDPAEFGGIEKTWLPLEKIWVPDIIIFNMLDHEDLLTAVRAPGLIYYNGTVETSKPFVSTVSCEIHIEHFPLDDQNCSLEIASWTYGKDKIKLHGHKEHATDHYTQNEEWNLLRVHVVEQEFDHEGINVSEIKYEIHVKRKPLFYMVTLTFPSYIMCAISVVGLYARFSTTGEREERFTLGVTAILTMAVLSLVVSEKVPHSSTDVPLLVAYFLFNMVVVSVAAMTTGIVMRVHRMGRYGREPPAWLVYIFLLRPNKYSRIRRCPSSPLHQVVVPERNGTTDVTQKKIRLIETFIKRLIEACEHIQAQMDEVDVVEHVSSRRRQEGNGFVRIAERLDLIFMTFFLTIVTIPVGRRNVHFNVGGGAAGEEERKTTDTVHEGQHTLNQKSWRNIATLEHPPIIDFYRDSIDAVDVNRPSMAQLIHGHGEQPIHEESLEIDQFKEEALHVLDQHPPIDEPGREEDKEKIEKLKAPDQGAGRKKFGWIEGVFVRCLLSIFGVILYLRISWVTGQAGIVLGILIVLLSTLVTVITAISTCAICTNGEVKGGGAYFLISRSLGPDELNFIRIVAMLFLLTMVAVIFIGTSFESKIQMGLLVLLLASIVDYFAGALILEPTMHTKVRGATALSMRTFLANLTPQFGRRRTSSPCLPSTSRPLLELWLGRTFLGDLANPQKAIPLGTLLAILATTIVYIFIVIFTGSTNVRHADGILEPMWDAVGFFVPPNCTIEEGGCKYGLLNFYQVIEMQALFGPLITAGIFAATLSSALGSLVAAPKIFQAVCKDRLFPGIDYFGKGFGRDEEPRRAYALVAVLALLVILVGDLNAIAPIISNFFLASYAILNYACFDQSFADSPGFRPGFKYYNKWVSLAGSILCVVVMFIVSWITALLTFFFFALIFIYLWHRKPDVNWGSSTQAHSYRNALAGMVKLANTEEHVKNYRPQLLVLTGNPASRPSLVDFVGNITKGNSLMVCGYVVPVATGSFAENFPFDFDLDDSEADSEGEYLDAEDEKPQTTEECERIPLKEQKTNMSIRRRGSRRTTVEQKALLTSMSRFSKKIREGTIDVWWLYDDGGLSLLIPHLLTIPKSYLEGAKLRVFSISTSRHTMEAEQRGLVALLTKFRIDFSNVSVMSDIGKKPKPET
ncbi:unnamed protein product, partial [Mesorhabditis spiculigera]